MGSWISLGEGEAVRCWAMSEALELYYPGVPRPMENRFSYIFRNGWVDTGDLPCREALRAWVAERSLALPECAFTKLALASEDDTIEFSSFRHRPTLITRVFTVALCGEGPAEFKLVTCGGVHLWLDGEKAGSFEPFIRNTPQETVIKLPLTGGPQTLVLQLEDLYERDTVCFFSLKLISAKQLRVGLPEALDAERAYKVASLIGSLHTDRIFYGESQQVKLLTEVLIDAPIKLQISDLGGSARGGITRDLERSARVDIVLSSTEPSADIASVSNLPRGCVSIAVEAEVNGAQITRQLGTTVIGSRLSLSGDWSYRQQQVQNYLVQHDGFEPSLALLKAQASVPVENWIRVVETGLATIEQRYDCSDFTILPLLLLFQRYPEQLDASLKARMTDAFTNYRYWFDEPGNDVMWFWSENHALCFHSAQYIAGELFADSRFSASNRTGREQQSIARERLKAWFEAIERDGLCEWNSSAYYPIDMLALIVLYEAAPEFRAQAKQLLDQILFMSALHTQGGSAVGVQGRCYEKELLAGPYTELGQVIAMILGDQFEAGYDRVTALLALSDYTPPADLARYACLGPGESLFAEYVQGSGGTGRLNLWKSARAQLSTTQPLQPGIRGHQAQYIDVQLALHPFARLWINHPGELKPWGERRPSLLAGSQVVPAVAQHGADALMLFNLDPALTDIGFTQLFAPAEIFGEPSRVGEWLVFADEIGVWCSSALKVVDSGQYRNALWRASGMQSGWCVSLRRENEDLMVFQTRLKRTRPRFSEQHLTVAMDLGSCLQLYANGTFEIDGQLSDWCNFSTTPMVAWNGGDLRPIGDQ